MRKFSFFTRIVLAISSVLSFSCYATPDPNAPIIHVRIDDPVNLLDGCMEEGTPLNNCFTDVLAMGDWVNDTRQPDAASPLEIKFGPGTFDQGGKSLSFNCASYPGYIAISGVGRGITKILVSKGSNISAALAFSQCERVSVSDITIQSTNASGYTVDWRGKGGLSTWSNVEVLAAGIGWYDSVIGGSCAIEEAGRHEWYSSSIRVTPGAEVSGFITGANYGPIAYYSLCGKSWFWGSEIANENYNPTNIRRGILAGPIGTGSDGNGAEIHIYGGNISLTSPQPSDAPMVAAHAARGGKIHVHGTGIDVIGNGATPVTSLKAEVGGFIHASSSSYVISSGSGGTSTRISVDNDPTSRVEAPFDWGPKTNAPGIVSVTGADTWTDISSNEPILMVYNSTCNGTGGPWFDSITQLCRGETPPANYGPQLPATGQQGDTFIETDCESDGDCDAGTGTEAHMMINNDFCATINNQPWFDFTRGKCRGAQ